MDAIEKLRKEVLDANLGIYRGGLVTEHAGNASGIDRKRGLVKRVGGDNAFRRLFHGSAAGEVEARDNLALDALNGEL